MLNSYRCFHNLLLWQIILLFNLLYKSITGFKLKIDHQVYTKSIKVPILLNFYVSDVEFLIQNQSYFKKIIILQ
jgi:hypothetical protein